MKAKRKVSIILDQRSIIDSSALLENIANSFPNDNIIIKLNHKGNLRDRNKNIRKDIELEHEAIDFASKVLDDAETSIRKKEEKKNNSSETKNKIKEYFKKLSLEGVQVSVTTVLKSTIQELFK